MDDPLSLEGEGWGEGEHTALVVIPFTLCSLLLCNGMACERANYWGFLSPVGEFLNPVP